VTYVSRGNLTTAVPDIGRRLLVRHGESGSASALALRTSSNRARSTSTDGAIGDERRSYPAPSCGRRWDRRLRARRDDRSCRMRSWYAPRHARDSELARLRASRWECRKAWKGAASISLPLRRRRVASAAGRDRECAADRVHACGVELGDRLGQERLWDGAEVVEADGALDGQSVLWSKFRPRCRSLESCA
jgi:hypothetical protein